MQTQWAKGFREAVRGYTDTKQAELAAEVAKASAENGEAAARLEAEAEARAIESEIKTTEAEVRSENAKAPVTASEVRAESGVEASDAVSARAAESGEAKVISENRVENASTAPEGEKFAEPSENVSVALGKANASAVDTVNTDVASTAEPVTVKGGEAKRYASPSESVSEALAVGGSAQQKNVKAEQNVAQEERKGDISENADVEQKSYAEPVGSVSEAMGTNEDDEVGIDIEGESEGESKKPAEVVVKKKSSIWSPIARFFRSGTTAVDIDSDGIERKTGITDSPTFLITGKDRDVIREKAKSLGVRVSYMDDSTAYTSGKNVKGSASASGRDVRIFLDNIKREVKARAEANGEVLSEKELNARIASEAVRVTYHEFGHIMEVYAKEAFADFKALAKERYIKKHGEDGFNRAWEELNKNEGRELSEGEVESELACDMIPELLEDKKFLSLFEKQMNRDRTAFGRFLNALGELLSRVRSFFESLGFTKRTDDELSLRKLYIELRQSFNRASAEYRRQERQGVVAGTVVFDKKTGEVLRENEERKGEVYKNGNGTNKFFDYSKNDFAKQIDDYLNPNPRLRKMPPYDSFLIGDTPQILCDIGFNALPMTINKTHIDYALNGTKDFDHEVFIDVLKKVPDALKNPVMVMENDSVKGRAIIVLKITAKNGEKLYLPVEIDGQASSNGIRIDSNAITSLLGKTNVDDKISNALNNEAQGNTSVFYWNKKEAISLLQRRGHQLPTRLPQDGFVHSIREKGSSVKTKLNDVTNSLQFKRWFGDWENNPEKASKVVNEDGTPKVVYHGTKAEFDTFMHEYIGENGTSYGKGFYLTDDYEYAESYAGNGDGRVYGEYCDIKKPLDLEKKSISRSDFQRFLVELSKTEDEGKQYYILSNFADVDKLGQNAAINEAMKLVYENAENDVEAISDLYNSITGISLKDYYKILRKVTGYDGVIANEGNRTIYVIFNSDQIKSPYNVGTYDRRYDNTFYSTVDTRKLGEEFDREKAEGAVTDGVAGDGEGLDAEGVGDVENSEVGGGNVGDVGDDGNGGVGDGERILPEYNSRGQKVSKFAETVADVGMRLNKAGRTEEGADMVEAAKRIAENPVEYKTETMSHEVTAKAAERAREKNISTTLLT